MNNLTYADLKDVLIVTDLELCISDAETLEDDYELVDTREPLENFAKNANSLKYTSESYKGIDYKNIVSYQLNKGDMRKDALFFENLNNTGFNLIIWK